MSTKIYVPTKYNVYSTNNADIIQCNLLYIERKIGFLSLFRF